jgi:hypothetical protein
MHVSCEREPRQRGPVVVVRAGCGPPRVAPTPIATLRNSTWMTSTTTLDIASAEPPQGTLEDVDYIRKAPQHKIEKRQCRASAT